MQQSLFHCQQTKEGHRLEPNQENTVAKGLSWVHLGGTRRPPDGWTTYAWLIKPTLGTRVFYTILEFSRGCCLSCELDCLVLDMLEANQRPTLHFLPFMLSIISNTRLCRLGRNNLPKALGHSNPKLCSEQIQGPFLGSIQLYLGSTNPTGPEYLHVPCGHAREWGLNWDLRWQLVLYQGYEEGMVSGMPDGRTTSIDNLYKASILTPSMTLDQNHDINSHQLHKKRAQL